MKPRSAKAKGTRLEKDIAAMIDAIPGWKARRQPGSGIYHGFGHDVYAERCDGLKFVVECKARAEGHRTLDRWMGEAELLIIRADRSPPMAYLSMRLLADLMSWGAK